MADKDQGYRIFVGGLSWDMTERQLESAFSRFGKIVDCKVMLERDTCRPRGFGFITFGDRRAMDDAIRDMHGRELGDQIISVNKAEPKMGSEDPGHGYGSYWGRYNGGDRAATDCFKCGRPGHWASDCPSEGGVLGGRPFSPLRPRFGGRGDLFADDRDRYLVDDRYHRGRFGDRDRYDDRYGIPYGYAAAAAAANDRYVPVSDRYPRSGYWKDRSYDRDCEPRHRYGGCGGPTRYEGRSIRDRPAPYDRPRRRGLPKVFSTTTLEIVNEWHGS